jgi:hypothetical protein
MKHLKMLLAAGLVIGLVSSAGASMIGVNAYAKDSSTTVEPTDMAGAPGYDQMYWNNFAPDGGHSPSPALLDSTGATTSVKVSYGDDFYGGTTGADGTPDGELMKGYHQFNSHSTVWITFSGLTPGDTWDMVIYQDHKSKAIPVGLQVRDASGTSSMVTIQQADWATADDWDDATSDLTGNYYVFSDVVVDDSGQLAFSTTEIDDGGDRPGFNAVQLVPEPATMSLLALGGLGVLIRRKK